ncbi:MAG TPA: ABC transporter permease [Acidimicrobiales bacterium]
MVAVLVARAARLLPVLFLVSVATFLLLELVPGDPAVAVLGTAGTPEQYEAIHRELGLDEPLLQRYWDWVTDALQGDLGNSLVPPNRPVTEVILARLPVTIEVAVVAMVLALGISIPLGLWSAYRAESRFDRVTSGVTFGLVSLPSFLLGLLLIVVFVFDTMAARVTTTVGLGALAARIGWEARNQSGARARACYLVPAVALLAGAVACALAWPELPRQGYVRITDDRGVAENLRTTLLPALTLALAEAAVFSRLLRNDVTNTLQEDFILAARAKGMPVWHVLVREALRPSSFSLITIAGVSLGRLLGGTVIVETLFGLPGMGTLMVDAINAKDFRVVQSVVLLVAVTFMLLNAIVDITYAYLDPRIRRG